MWSCPTYSSRVRGRIRAASGSSVGDANNDVSRVTVAAPHEGASERAAVPGAARDLGGVDSWLESTCGPRRRRTPVRRRGRARRRVPDPADPAALGTSDVALDRSGAAP